MLAQAGAIRWYVDRVGYLSKRMIFFQNSDLKLIESPCILVRVWYDFSTVFRCEKHDFLDEKFFDHTRGT